VHLLIFVAVRNTQPRISIIDCCAHIDGMTTNGSDRALTAQISVDSAELIVGADLFESLHIVRFRCLAICV
jgi:hypothetical protein